MARAAHNQLMIFFAGGIQVSIASERDASPQPERPACQSQHVGEDVCPGGGRRVGKEDTPPGWRGSASPVAIFGQPRQSV